MTPNINNAITRFTNHCHARLGFAKSTVALNIGMLKRFASIIGLHPSHEAIEQYITSMHQSEKTKTYIAATAIAIEHYMSMIGNPIKLGRPRKQQRQQITTLTEAEIAVLLFCTNTTRQRAILSILAYTGIRNNELCNLRTKDFDYNKQTIYVNKGKAETSRTVCVSGDCTKTLTSYIQQSNRQPDELLFVTIRKHAQLAGQDIRKIIRVAAKKAKITKRIHPHLLRHSLATHMLHRGASLYTIKEQLGHRYLETTLLYLHANKDRLVADYHQYCPSYL